MVKHEAVIFLDDVIYLYKVNSRGQKHINSYLRMMYDAFGISEDEVILNYFSAITFEIN